MLERQRLVFGASIVQTGFQIRPTGDIPGLEFVALKPPVRPKQHTAKPVARRKAHIGQWRSGCSGQDIGVCTLVTRQSLLIALDSASLPPEKRLGAAAMAMATQVAHMNVARLRHVPGDPRVAGFIDNVQKVNSLAERSPGYVWRFCDEALSVVEGVVFQGLAGDPKLAISLSVWEAVEHLWQFVNKSVHGGFLRNRERWFEAYGGPNDVLWSHVLDTPPDISEGWDRLKLLAEKGAAPQAFDFAFAGVKRDS